MEKDHLSRKLAVILHADVVGSTSLVQQNEMLAHQRIQTAFHQFSETISSYGGITHELRGDALVAEFNRASDAVPAAIAFQALNEEANNALEDDLRPQLRIGISLGEVVIADNTVTGAGVVLAQRLEQLADTGGVVVQGSVAETVPTRMPFNFESLGEQMLKGFDQPVRAFSASLQEGQTLPAPEVTATLSSAEPARELPEKPSIAILPFQNMSADPEQEYFADGITEDIITELSKISGLMVISRTSTFTYKGRATKAQEVCRDLGVRYMLEGSVRKAGQQVRITAQLIDGISGGHLWAERYDRGLADIFAVQDDVTEKIVGALEVNLVTDANDRPARMETDNPEAYDCVLRGREQFRLFSKDGNLNASRLYKQAIELDPNYAAAYAGLAMTCLHEWFQGSQDELESAYNLALKANDLGPSLPIVCEALGNVQLFRRQYDEAVAVARRWIMIEPGNADAYANLAGALIVRGEPEQVISLVDKAMRLNPFYPFYYILYKGLAYQEMERYEEALDA
ncbi:MAG: adenylate/guanylate cyclase domain-containing protein, partial [Gammaproteobacteria bacterium]